MVLPIAKGVKETDFRAEARTPSNSSAPSPASDIIVAGLGASTLAGAAMDRGRSAVVFAVVSAGWAGFGQSSPLPADATTRTSTISSGRASWVTPTAVHEG